jgi:hypothetical protein
MSSVTSKKLPYIASIQFRESFYEPSPEVGYVYIGRPLAYTDENFPSPAIDSIEEEKLVWENMIGAKKITGNDVELVIPLVSWTANTKYKQYDDLIDLEDLITGDISLNVKPMYVYTSERNVYKCLSNNASANSVVEPTGDYISSNGNISTSDGFIWKYMFNVRPSNKFLTNEWIPVPIGTNQLDYGVSSTGVIDGELTTIVVTSSGLGFYENNVSVIPTFSSGCTVLTLANTTNVAANMSVSGVGIVPGTYIRNIDVPNNNIALSFATSGSGGGNTTANQIALTTRIYIDGDGIGAVARSTINSAGYLTKVTVTTIGTGYSRANAFVYGTGSGATLRVIRDMKYGHARNPAKELGANSVMIVSRMGEIDSTENGKIPANTSFRQYGVLVNPHKYGNSQAVSATSANAVISQATSLIMTTGSNYTIGEFVYQGFANDTSASSTTAYGFVLDQTATQVRLTNVRGIFKTGFPLRGTSSGIADRLVISVQNPEFQPYSGDVIYTENAFKTQRSEGQAENIKLIVRF